MADKNDKSTLRSLAIATPVVAGAGLSIFELNKANLLTLDSLTKDPAESINNFTEKYTSINPSLNTNLHLDRLAHFADNTALDPNDIKSMLRRAAFLADPSGRVWETLGARIPTRYSSSEILESLFYQAGSSNSYRMNRALFTFLDELQIMDTRLSQDLSIKTQELFSSPPLKRRSLALSQLSPSVSADIVEAAKQLNLDFSIFEKYREDLAGSELNIEFKSKGPGRKSLFTLRVPRVLENDALIRAGASQQSTYIAGKYGLVENGVLSRIFNHEEYTVNRFLSEIVPELSTKQRIERRYANTLLNEFHNEIMESPEWIPTMQARKHAGIDEYIAERSNRLNLFTQGAEGLRPINEFEYHRIISKGGIETAAGEHIPLFPGASPSQIAHGVVSTKDFREAYSLVPEAFPYARRPAQFIRNSAEPLAIDLIAGDQTTNRFFWAYSDFGVNTPMLKTAYVSSSLDDKLSGTGLSSEGQMLVSNRKSGLRAVTEWKQFDIASDQIGELADMMSRDRSGFWPINKQAYSETFLGRDPTGKPVILDDEMTIVHATAFSDDKAKGDFIRVMAKHDIEDTSITKVIGGGKGMMVEVNQNYIHNILKERAGVSWLVNPVQPEIDALVTMDELRKNRSLHYNQMFTQMWDFAEQNMQSGKNMNPLARMFVSNPLESIAKMRSVANNNGIFSHESMLKDIVRVARGASLSPQQMGRVFGAVEEVYGSLDLMGSLSQAELSEIKKGVATGAAQFWHVSELGPGAGNLATIEPRTLELLSAPHFGELGKEIQADIAERMSISNYDLLLEQKELEKSLASFSKNIAEGISPNELSSRSLIEGLPKEGTHLRVKGIGNVYIPGVTDMPSLMGYQTASGAIIHTPLSRSYQQFIEDASRFSAKEISEDQMKETIASLENKVSAARVATVTGSENKVSGAQVATATSSRGLARGKLPGSVFLTAREPTLADKLPPNTIGITEPYAEKMFTSMERLGIYSQNDIELMRKRFSSGKDLSAIIGRHPYIGPYSSQAVKVRKVEGKKAVAVINERRARAIAFSGTRTDLADLERGAKNLFRTNAKQLAYQAAQIGGEDVGTLRFSALPGLAGDVDGDNVSIMLAGPQLQDKVDRHLNSTITQKAYEEYSIRSQLLKAKAASKEEVTLAKMMAGDVIKLGVTEGGRLGKLSTQLQKYRASVLSGAGGLSTEEGMEALGLLEWMEQTPISSKHIAPGREMETISLLDNLQESLIRKDAEGMRNAVNTVMTHAKSSGRAALEEGMTVLMADEVSGNISSRFIKGLNVDRAITNIVSARQAFETMKVGGVSAARMRELLMGRVKDFAEADRLALLDKQALSVSPLGVFLNEGLEKGSSLTSRAASRLMGFGKKVKPHMKPLLIGAGIATGLSMFLSDPKTSFPKGRNIAPVANLKSGTGGGDLGFDHRSNPPVSRPRHPNLTQSQHKVRLSQPEGGYRVDVQGDSSDEVDIRQIAQEVRGVAGRQSGVRSLLKDMRGSLTPQKIASLIE